MRFELSMHQSAMAAVVAVALPLASTSARAQVPPPPVTASAWLLVDATSNQVLASQNAQQRVEPASLTKLMTTYIVFGALRKGTISLDQIVTPTDAVRRVGRDESRMFIEAEKPVSVHDLLHGMVTQSGNDAAIALAEVVGGSEQGFVAMMNDTAKRLGMKDSHFADVNGMPDANHYTTAGDLANLSVHLIRDFPDYYPIFAERDFKYNNIKQPNRNRLLWLDPTVDGLKTGHTKAAGYCLIATAKRDLPNVPGASRRLVSVIMGEPTERARVQDSLKMLNYGYQAFDAVRIYEASKPVRTERVYKGKSKEVRVGVKTDQYVTVPKGMAGKLQSVVVLDTPLIAPLRAGQQVGYTAVTGEGKELQRIPLLALDAVPEAGLFGRLWDTMWMKFDKKK